MNFDSHTESLSQLQAEKKSLSEALKLKDVELGDKTSKIECLDGQISSLAAHNEMAVAETEKVILVINFHILYTPAYCLNLYLCNMFYCRFLLVLFDNLSLEYISKPTFQLLFY